MSLSEMGPTRSMPELPLDTKSSSPRSIGSPPTGSMPAVAGVVPSAAGVYTETASPIRDLAGMFHAVSLAEAVRDTARDLMKFAPAEQLAASPVVGQLAEAFNQLRSDLAATLEPDAAESLLDRVAVLQTGEVDVFCVYAASVRLVRLVGVLHKTPQFLLSEHMEASAAREITDRLKSAPDPDHEAAAEPVARGGLQLGAYL